MGVKFYHRLKEHLFLCHSINMFDYLYRKLTVQYTENQTIITHVKKNDPITISITLLYPNKLRARIWIVGWSFSYTLFIKKLRVGFKTTNAYKFRPSQLPYLSFVKKWLYLVNCLLEYIDTKSFRTKLLCILTQKAYKMYYPVNTV